MIERHVTTLMGERSHKCFLMKHTGSLNSRKNKGLRSKMRFLLFVECRTRWFDDDNPRGNGDFGLTTQTKTIELPKDTHQPSSPCCSYDATFGFACVNAEQGSKRCEDYKVRFTCPNEFCEEQCRTQWLNSDDPSDEGDVESIFQLLKAFPGQVCGNPVSIEAQSTSRISSFLFSGKQCKDYQLVCLPY
uniref:WxxW domain-containing protein n=1 Tax=Gasterosteus aculeatus aculeatus TaxID=481459 RepID=A0AAQ4PP36_GASAC